MGKLTQYFRRIVQDVRDEGTSTRQTKKDVIIVHLRLRATTSRLESSYNIAKAALDNLHKEYGDSKGLYMFFRYGQLKRMIKPVIRLERDWTLLEVPKQVETESDQNFVLRACSCLKKAPSTQSCVFDYVKEWNERERLENLSCFQIERENTVLINHLYKLLIKYRGLRKLIKYLTIRYSASKYFIIIPRYLLLKHMIKSIIRDSRYKEARNSEDDQGVGCPGGQLSVQAREMQNNVNMVDKFTVYGQDEIEIVGGRWEEQSPSGSTSDSPKPNSRFYNTDEVFQLEFESEVGNDDEDVDASILAADRGEQSGDNSEADDIDRHKESKEFDFLPILEVEDEDSV